MSDVTNQESNKLNTPLSPTHTQSDPCPEALALLLPPYPLLSVGCCCYCLKIDITEHSGIHLLQESLQSLTWSARSCRSIFQAPNSIIVNITKQKSLQQLPLVQEGGQLFLPQPFWLGPRPVQKWLQHKEAGEVNHSIKNYL